MKEALSLSHSPKRKLLGALVCSLSVSYSFALLLCLCGGLRARQSPRSSRALRSACIHTPRAAQCGRFNVSFVPFLRAASHNTNTHIHTHTTSRKPKTLHTYTRILVITVGSWKGVCTSDRQCGCCCFRVNAPSSRAEVNAARVKNLLR